MQIKTPQPEKPQNNLGIYIIHIIMAAIT